MIFDKGVPEDGIDDVEVSEPGDHEKLAVGGLGERVLHAPAEAGLSDLFSLTDGLSWMGLNCQVKCWSFGPRPFPQKQQRC